MGEDSEPFKICLNCRFIGPDAPGKYDIPKGTPIPFYAHDREYIVVSEDEMHRLYQEYFDQVADMEKRMKGNKLWFYSSNYASIIVYNQFKVFLTVPLSLVNHAVGNYLYLKLFIMRIIVLILQLGDK